MFENRQLAVFEGKCRRFRDSSECLKTHCAVKNDQFGRRSFQKKRKDVDYKHLKEFFQKKIFYMNGRNIRMEKGRFLFLRVSVYP